MNNYKLTFIQIYQKKIKKKYIPVFLKFLEEGDEDYLGYYQNKCVHRQWIQKNYLNE